MHHGMIHQELVVGDDLDLDMGVAEDLDLDQDIAVEDNHDLDPDFDLDMGVVEQKLEVWQVWVEVAVSEMLEVITLESLVLASECH